MSRSATSFVILMLFAFLQSAVWYRPGLADEEPPAAEPSPLAEISKLQWRRLLSWDRDEAKLWNVDSDQPLMTFSRKSEEVLGPSFRTDTPWIVIPDQESDMAARIRKLWKSVKELPVPGFQAPGSRRIVISRDLTRACALHDSSVAELLSPALDVPLFKLRPASYEGAMFNADSTRLLTWGRGLQFWEITLRDERTIELQLRDHQIRTATRLNDSGGTRVLPLQDWQEMLQATD